MVLGLGLAMGLVSDGVDDVIFYVFSQLFLCFCAFMLKGDYAWSHHQ